MARPDLSWQDSALCAQTDPDLPFDQPRIAKRICGSCEARAECLADALAAGDQHGIRGGLTPKERRRLRRPAGQHAA